jgi:hypothetical protein
MVVFIAKTIDGTEALSDIWGKLIRIYPGIDNNMRVFRIEREIEEVAQNVGRFRNMPQIYSDCGNSMTISLLLSVV